MSEDILATIAASNVERFEALQDGEWDARALELLCDRDDGSRVFGEAFGIDLAPRPHDCFEKALREEGLSFICEVKKASPSKGVISEQFPYLDIARAYEDAGATCISCLTEPRWFKGSDEIFMEIRSAVGTPMLRKDFIVSGRTDAYGYTLGEFQIRQSRLMGADCVLLICSLLDKPGLTHYLDLCRALHMSALVETHDEAEIALALDCGARIIGVNNRNLRDFSVDFANAQRLRSLIPDECIYVAESGVKSAEDTRLLRECGADAVLVGEALMRAPDKRAMLDELRGGAL